MSLLIWNKPPGLKRQEIVSGIPTNFSKKSMCVKSSKLIIAPNLFANIKSSSGVTLEENIISEPVMPTASDKSSSV